MEPKPHKNGEHNYEENYNKYGVLLDYLFNCLIDIH